MRFCDKLSKQRKNNNLSQEQLADKLNVSRQAVSKWESGSSYPDMDKIISMCNILNCTLEDLLDDGVVGNQSNNNSKVNINMYLQDLLKFITKTYNMFCSMKFKEKIKCLFEMTMLGILLIVIGVVIFIILNVITSNLLSIIPFNIGNYIEQILNNIYFIALLILGIIIFLHLFKIRYLDYFITIEDNNVSEKSIEKDVNKKENKYYIEKSKEKIIIRDPKHSSFSFFNLLGQMITLCFKFFLIMFVIPFIFLFVFLIFISIISLCHSIYGSIFFLLALSILGLILLTYIILNFVYNFIFNRNQNFKRIFILCIVGLTMLGVFSGLTFTSFLKYDYIENFDDFEKNKKIEYIDINSNTSIQFLTDCDVEYKIDNTLENAKIEIIYPENINYVLTHNEYDNSDYYYIRIEELNFFKLYNIIINDIKDEKIRNYNYMDLLEITIYVSKSDYEILKSNQF